MVRGEGGQRGPLCARRPGPDPARRSPWWQGSWVPPLSKTQALGLAGMLLQALNPSGTCKSEQPFRACTQGCRHHRWGEKSPNFGSHTTLHPSPMMGARNVEQAAAEIPVRTSPGASNSPGRAAWTAQATSGGYSRIRPRHSCSSLGSAMRTHHCGLWVPGSGHGALRNTPRWDLALLFLHSDPMRVSISAWKSNLPKTLHLAKNGSLRFFPSWGSQFWWICTQTGLGHSYFGYRCGRLHKL